MSAEALSKYLKPCGSSYLLRKELDYLRGAVDAPKKPRAANVGGTSPLRRQRW